MSESDWKYLSDRLGLEVPFDHDVVKALTAAEAIARDEQINFVSTEHLLLGLIQAGLLSNATALLKQCGVDSLGRLRQALLDAKGGPGNMYRPNDPIALTGNAERALEIADEEAEVAGAKHIELIHLLLGLIRQRTGLAGRTLAAFGVDEKSFRAARDGLPPHS